MERHPLDEAGQNLLVRRFLLSSDRAGHDVPNAAAVNNALMTSNCRARAGDTAGLSKSGSSDIPWVPGRGQRDRADRREEMHELFRSALVVRGLTFAEIRGSGDSRLDAAVAAIDGLIEHAS